MLRKQRNLVSSLPVRPLARPEDVESFKQSRQRKLEKCPLNQKFAGVATDPWRPQSAATTAAAPSR